MLGNIVLASMALLGGLASAASVGQAVVINNCDYSVYLANTPSADGVHQTYSTTLKPGQTYSQTYTKLDNLMGWSIKLAQSANFPSDATFQYEYTFLDDGTIWFDMSNVNNQVWDFQKDISSSDCDCDSTLRQVAYLFPEDNSAMETNCTQSADVTVAICQAPGSMTCADSPSSSWPTLSLPSLSLPSLTLPNILPSTSHSSSTVQSTSSVAPPPAPTTTTHAAAPVHPSSHAEPVAYTSARNGPIIPAFSGPILQQADVATSAPSPVPTTLETSTLASDGYEVVWVTDVVTEDFTLTTTVFAEATAVAKRHEHHLHGHAHGHF